MSQSERESVEGTISQSVSQFVDQSEFFIVKEAPQEKREMINKAQLTAATQERMDEWSIERSFSG